MPSPAELLLYTAEQKLSVDRLLRRRKELIKDIPTAVDTLPLNAAIELYDYATADNEQLSVTVACSNTLNDTDAARKQIFISGTLSQEEGKFSTNFPMYRITQVVPRSDGGGHQTPMYEIAAADPESEQGYSPLVLVEQSLLIRGSNPRVEPSEQIIYDVFGSHDALSSDQANKLKATGTYVNPQAKDLINEVHDIISLALAQYKDPTHGETFTSAEDEQAEKAPTLEKAQAIVNECWKNKDYRPIVVVAMRNQAGEVLLAQTRKHPNEWDLIKGGVDEGEDILDGALRETNEETNIPASQLRLGPLTEIIKIDRPEGKGPDRRGFSKGKCYIVVQAEYTGNGSKVRVSKDELRRAQWTRRTVAQEYLRKLGKSSEKADLVDRAIKWINKNIAQSD